MIGHLAVVERQGCRRWRVDGLVNFAPDSGRQKTLLSPPHHLRLDMAGRAKGRRSKRLRSPSPDDVSDGLPDISTIIANSKKAPKKPRTTSARNSSSKATQGTPTVMTGTDAAPTGHDSQASNVHCQG